MRWILLTLFTVLISGQTFAADIYRSRDEQGRPVFSDAATEDAVKVEVREPMTFPGALPEEPQPAVVSTPAGPPYRIISITSPAQDEAVRENTGNLTVSFELAPSLRPGDSLVLLFDGAIATEVQAVVPIDMKNIDRGTHQLELQVIERASNIKLQSSGVVSFTMLRHSILNKAH